MTVNNNRLTNQYFLLNIFNVSRCRNVLHDCLHLVTLWLLCQREYNPQFSGTLEALKWHTDITMSVTTRFYLWHSCSHNRTKINIQFLNDAAYKIHVEESILIQKYIPPTPSTIFLQPGETTSWQSGQSRQELPPSHPKINKRMSEYLQLNNTYPFFLMTFNLCHEKYTFK